MKRLLPDTFTLLLVATVVLASFLPIAGEPAEWFGLATNLAIALLFFLHGARLSTDVVVAGFLHWRLQSFILAVTFVVFPLLGLLLGLLSPWLIPPALYLGLLYVCVLPSTVQSSIAFTSIAGGNVPAAICAASASNILGMFLTPALVAVLFTAGGHVGVSLEMIWKILLQLFAPFVLGQILQPFIGNWIRARKSLLAPVDRGSILMVVYLAFSNAVIEGIWSNVSTADLALVIGLDIALLVIVLLITTFASKLFGFSREDRIAAIFCGSKKSLASGVPMAGVIFAGQSVGAIVLPLMLFHQIQLMVCAWLARGFAQKRAQTERVLKAAA
ncbi:solute carrier family 10 (sodium/bile acid cotransporter), member 7 [Rhizobium sp. RU20A]|uniref:bile acid:sodium symporter family protein n=1 Tax=Rhizobium sp. RU20A TaxID=1907412 RepID=UPI0009543E98|nr:bile acid:sodium symporter family protein [Rhizobium sp. RU20A]SIR43106.1 solute carrier family 10 (sodium/bile acid cotransporter), member 7 [Rhizobium sp. RU20A]